MKIKTKNKLIYCRLFEIWFAALVKVVGRGGCGSVGSVKGPFDVCRWLNAPPAAPAPLIISNFPVIYYLYRYLFVQFHGYMTFLTSLRVRCARINYIESLSPQRDGIITN